MMNKTDNQVFEKNPVPLVYVKKGSWNVLGVNEAFSKRFVGCHEICGKSLNTFLEKIPMDILPHGRILEKTGYYSFRHPDESRVLVELRTSEVVNEQEEILLASFHEMFPMMTNECIDHPVYKSVFDKARDIILVANDEGRFIQINQTACAKLGYTKKELLSMSVQDITYTTIKSYAEKKWNDFLSTGSDAGEFLLKTKSGSVLYTEYRAVANIRPGMHLSVLRDRTTEERHRNRLYQILQSSPGSILIVNQRGSIEFCNEKSEELFGYTRQELIGNKIDILIPDVFKKAHSKSVNKYFENLMPRSMGSGLKIVARRKDGAELPVDISLGPLEEDGEKKALAIIIDKSEHFEIQEVLKFEKGFINLLHELSEADNKVDNIEELVSLSVEKICAYMGWPVGHSYLPVSDGSGEFAPSGIWYLSDPGKFSLFKSITQQTRFSPGEGMVGKIIATGEPKWMTNCQNDPEFVRRFDDLDLKVRSSIGVPILIENYVAGVLEFFTDKTLPVNHNLLGKVSTIGHQVGRVLDRKLSQQKLEESEEKFRTLFNSIDDAILITDGLQLIDCNASAMGMFKCTCDKTTEKPLELFFKGNTAFISKKVEEALSGQRIKIELNLGTGNEEYQIVNARIIPVKLGDKFLAQIIISDITEQKTKENLIKRNVELFNQLFLNSPVGVVMLNKEGLVGKVNNSFVEIFGFSHDELIGRKLDDLIVPENEKSKAADLSNKSYTGKIMQTESIRLKKDGTEVPVLIGGVPVNIEGETIAIFGMYVNITNRIKTEKKLERSLKEKVTLLAEVHHRVKNNLALISGLMELQIAETDNALVEKVFRENQSRIKSMALIHEQLYQVGLFSAVQFGSYIKKMGLELHKTYSHDKKDINLEFDVEPLLFKMEQAIPCGLLVNEILVNSLKHAFKDADSGLIKVTMKKNNDTVHLRISDNGIGIPDGLIMKNAESLGLTLIQMLASQLNGSLNFHVNGGTTYTLEFEITDN